MVHSRESLFCGIELGARIERAEVDLIEAAGAAAVARLGTGTGFAIAIAGGIAGFATAGSPLNKVAGLGFAGVPSEAEMAEVEQEFAAHGAPVQVELTNLADPEIGALLTRRGYQLVSYENVLGITLDSTTAPELPDSIDVRISDATEFDTWLDTLADGFAHPDTQGVASHEEFPREVLADAMRDLISAAGMTRYTARHHGQIAGAASLRITQQVAQLTGAATLPTHRRNGIQSALLTTRLAAATTAGCDIAVITTQPGSKSQQNAQRRGFDLLYTRAILIKDVSAAV